MDENIFKKILKFFTNRLLILAVCTFLAFYALITRLFQLQIVEGETYLSGLQQTAIESLTIPAPRGTIYDKYGRPLAVNQSAFTIRIDPSVQVPDMTEMLYNLVKLFEDTGQEYVDNFPISKEEPYTFLFNDSAAREKQWKTDMTVPNEATAEQAIAYLREHFKLDPALPNSEARKILALRSNVYMQRFSMYNPVTVAYNANEKTIAAIEEQNRDFPGVYVDVEALRMYPMGEYFSHLVGYIGKINDKEYEQLKNKNYTKFDIIGKTGLEKSFEEELRGEDGKMLVEVNSVGRRVRTINVMHPVQGDKIFLTVDANLQKRSFEILENMLTEIIKNKMQGKAAKESPITLVQFFSSMLKSNNISMKKIFSAKEDTVSYLVKEYIISVQPEANADSKEAIGVAQTILAEGMEQGRVTAADMLIILVEQEIISVDEELRARIVKKQANVLQVILDKLTQGEITPQMTNLDPCTGSIVVVDVNTGSVITSVSYPTYDTNQLVNNFNNEYYYKINEDDPTTPVINRAFMEPRAPGSTFKMITALAGLANGVITPNTTIYDYHTFTKAGRPYTSCHASYSHGSINVAHALEVSCNYFFCDVVYEMGNTKLGTQQRSLDGLKEYMIAFGLNERTGVEIGERRDFLPEAEYVVSLPEYREYMSKLYNPDAQPNDYAWYDGDTIRTAYGQGDNDYTAASMAKYVATLASGGKRYQMHFLNEVQHQDGKKVRGFEPVLETEIDIAPEYLQAIYEGMLLVTEGTYGTGRSVFTDFPIRVAGKTGTAQEKRIGRNDHSSFAGFAPYENPQIAIYVVLPFGDTKTTPAPAAQVAKAIIAEYMGISKEPEYYNQNNTLAR